MSPHVIHIPSAAGALPGELLTAEVPSGVLVVFAHGAGAGLGSPFMRRYAALLASRGLDVLTFNFPYLAQGRKLPDRPPVLEAAFRDAIEAAIAQLGDRVKAVVVAGKSMGGRMATHLAAQPGLWTSRLPLAAAVAFGYPLRPPGPRGGDRVSHLTRLAVPTLVVQGTRDTFGGPAEVSAATAGMANITVRPVETGDHSLVVTRASGIRQDQVESAIADDVVGFVTAAVAAGAARQP